MTQEQLGELADLNPKYIGEVERMEKTISIDSLARIAKALKVRLPDLVREHLGENHEKRKIFHLNH